MVKTKYVMSNGLAFGEKDDLKKLQKLSLKGWHVKDFKFMGYVLEKGEPEEYIYSLDYRNSISILLKRQVGFILHQKAMFICFGQDQVLLRFIVTQILQLKNIMNYFSS